MLKQPRSRGANTHLLQFACMDQLLRASEDRLDGILASLALSDDRKRGLLPDIAKWRRDPMSAIAFMSSVAAANAAAPSRYTVTAHTTMVRIALNETLHCTARLTASSLHRSNTAATLRPASMWYVYFIYMLAHHGCRPSHCCCFLPS